MPRINLLPWREQERKVRRREFLVAAGGAVIASREWYNSIMLYRKDFGGVLIELEQA